MTNLYVRSRYDERITQLALALEPLDAARRMRIGHSFNVTFDELPLGLPRPKVLRHGSGLCVLVHGEGVETSLVLRLFDLGEPTDPPIYRGETNRRRFVPRRLRIPIPSAAAAEALPLARRARRPVLFPGMAYDTTESVTGMRARVLRAGQPLRWARVQARRPGAAVSAPPVGRAQCDDRGEFLLLLDPAAAPMVTLERPFELDLLVHAPAPPAPMPAPEVRAVDELWDLPIEPLSNSGAPDPVAEGRFPPAGWQAPAPPARHEFVYGRLRREVPPLNV